MSLKEMTRRCPVTGVKEKRNLLSKLNAKKKLNQWELDEIFNSEENDDE